MDDAYFEEFKRWFSPRTAFSGCEVIFDPFLSSD